MWIGVQFGDRSQIIHRSIARWSDRRSRADRPVVGEYLGRECAAGGCLRGEVGEGVNCVGVEAEAIGINWVARQKDAGSAAGEFWTRLEREVAVTTDFGWQTNDLRAAVVVCAIF